MMSTIDPVQALTGSMRDFRELQGSDLMARVAPFYEWQERAGSGGCGRTRSRRRRRLSSVCTALDDSGVKFQG